MDKEISKQQQRSERRRRMLKILPWAAAGAALIGGIIWSVDSKSVRSSDIILREAETGPLESAVAASGRVVPAREMVVISPVTSRIMEVFAHPGDSVSAGTPLLSLDLSEAEAQLKNLEDAYRIKASALEQLRLSNRTERTDLEMKVSIKEMEVERLALEVENERRLDSLGSGTGDRVRQARTAHTTGELELRSLRQRLANERERLVALESSQALELESSLRDLRLMESTLAQGRIPAPQDGIITFLKTSLGSTVSAGERLAVVGDLSSFKVEAEVPEGASYKVKPGAEARINIGATVLSGTVANIEPQSNSGTVPFTVALTEASNSRLRPGISAQVYVSWGFKESVTRIPMGNYYKGPGEYELFVADGDVLHRRRIKLGDSNSSWVEVVAGLQPGEKVAINDMESYDSYSKLKIESK